MDGYADQDFDGGRTRAENDSSIEDRVNELETALAAQTATAAGTQATQAATLAGAQATQAASTAGVTSTMGAMQAGTMATMGAGAVAFILGIFLGMAITRDR